MRLTVTAFATFFALR